MLPIGSHPAAPTSLLRLWQRNGTVLSPATSTDTVQVGAGAVGAPGVAVGEANSGIYRIGAANLGLSLGGALALNASGSRLLSLVQLRVPIGSAAAPGLSAGPDAGAYLSTGLWWDFGGGTARLNVSVGGIDRASFTPAGLFLTDTYTLGWGDTVLSRSAANVLRLAAGDSMEFDDGAAATPVIRGLNFSTTGLYWIAGPRLDVAVAGVVRATFHSAGISTSQINLAGTPSGSINSPILNGSFLRFNPGMNLQWVDTNGTGSSNVDLALQRVSAGVLKVGAGLGTLTDYGTMQASAVEFTGTSSATDPAVLTRPAANVLRLAAGDAFELDNGAAATPVVRGLNFVTSGFYFAAGPLVGIAANGAAVATFAAAAITLTDAVDLVVGSTTGTKIGTATSQKLGFFNATPVTQRGAIADPAGGATVDAEARTAINAIILALEELGLLAT